MLTIFFLNYGMSRPEGLYEASLPKLSKTALAGFANPRFMQLCLRHHECFEQCYERDNTRNKSARLSLSETHCGCRCVSRQRPASNRQSDLSPAEEYGS